MHVIVYKDSFISNVKTIVKRSPGIDRDLHCLTSTAAMPPVYTEM